ncbi:MAG TPA: bifunctional pyr operon transcriptional regulator/uracil phosphoribosyltransferase PyrR [Spirochaetota bacterium]|nr:bifunctional pyr operon transcriptional regulator/uracil phosphoribosyltransferase PyrR [Spirochaetota bacterium]HPJ40519.1 bifunctional pyr operon transcriptional regulator/uracil phosphoribosyltransferase PyrR [Spirochaetota bacterium]
MSEKVILQKKDIDSIIEDTSNQIIKNIKNIDEFAIIGIQTRGVELANRIKSKLEEKSGKSIKSGILDITFYRDDIATRGMLPVIKETRIDFDISNMTILLVDDVLFTGRTTKAAIETLMSFGRPRAIRLFVLIDRGSRELPIQPDYCGYKTETTVKDKVKVRLLETDDIEDRVILS